MALSAVPGSAPQCAATAVRPVRRLIGAGARCAGYPGVERFEPGFGYRDYLQAVAARRTRGAFKPLSLYLHIPFCDPSCHYCGCAQEAEAGAYLAYLKREIDLQGMLFGGMNQLGQLHLGGGLPAYLSEHESGELMARLRRWFQLAPDHAGDYSVDIDGRSVTRERVFSLRRQGFNRIGLAVQDYDAQLRQVLEQPENQVEALVEAARVARFRSVSIDLVYALPGQDVAGIARALTRVVKADPDRVALYDYALLPQAGQTPYAAEERRDMLALCVAQLTRAGYVQIGADHFAKPLDDLVAAQRQGRLHRNFQGYSTHAGSDLLACGVAASAALGATCSQNAASLEAYCEMIDNNELPIMRGIRLGMDDALRRSIIQMLSCNFEVSIAAIETAYPIAFAQYFAPELVRLEVLARDGLLTFESGWLSVTTQGRPYLRTICKVFEHEPGAA